MRNGKRIAGTHPDSTFFEDPRRAVDQLLVGLQTGCAQAGECEGARRATFLIPTSLSLPMSRTNYELSGGLRRMEFELFNSLAGSTKSY